MTKIKWFKYLVVILMVAACASPAMAKKKGKKGKKGKKQPPPRHVESVGIVKEIGGGAVPINAEDLTEEGYKGLTKLSKWKRPSKKPPAKPTAKKKTKKK